MWEQTYKQVNKAFIYHGLVCPKCAYERAKFALCNMYHEWDGMQKIVAEERAKEGKPNEVFQL